MSELDHLEELHRQQRIEAATRASLLGAINDADAARERCKSLYNFVREAWPHIPALASVEYIEGWHIALICAHLEAITSGRLLRMGLQNRLLVNVPPGTMFWPAWEWTKFPHYQYITTSYREDYCTRDTSRMRDLVTSDWYQILWGKDRELPDGTKVRGVKMVAVGEMRISNSAGGWREGVPFGPNIAHRLE